MLVVGVGWAATLLRTMESADHSSSYIQTKGFGSATPSTQVFDLPCDSDV